MKTLVSIIYIVWRIFWQPTLHTWNIKSLYINNDNFVLYFPNLHFKQIDLNLGDFAEGL